MGENVQLTILLQCKFTMIRFLIFYRFWIEWVIFLQISIFLARYAADVSTGDEVLVAPEDNEFSPAKVVSVTSFKMQG